MSLNKNTIPQAYVDGEVVFYDLKLKVNSNCLIPRLESELLVERVLSRSSNKGDVLDLCTGSGALGLSIKKERPNMSVVLADKSVEALKIARDNAILNDLEVEIVEGDFLTPLEGRVFDVIICNPPYVTEEEYQRLDPSVKDYEPKMALTDGGDGLFFYRILAKSCEKFLTPSGLLCLEIGKDQGESVKALFSSDVWVKKELEKDYSGHDRFFFLEKRVEGS